MKVRDLFSECAIRIDPICPGWSVTLVDADGIEYAEVHETRESAVLAIEAWMALFDDDTEIPASETETLRTLAEMVREQLIRRRLGEYS